MHMSLNVFLREFELNWICLHRNELEWARSKLFGQIMTSSSKDGDDIFVFVFADCMFTHHINSGLQVCLHMLIVTNSYLACFASMTYW